MIRVTQIKVHLKYINLQQTNWFYLWYYANYDFISSQKIMVEDIIIKKHHQFLLGSGGFTIISSIQDKAPDNLKGNKR